MDGRHRISSIFLTHSPFTSTKALLSKQARDLIFSQCQDVLRGIFELFFLISSMFARWLLANACTKNAPAPRRKRMMVR
jgi:hypothetical protein